MRQLSQFASLSLLLLRIEVFDNALDKDTIFVCVRTFSSQGCVRFGIVVGLRAACTENASGRASACMQVSASRTRESQHVGDQSLKCHVRVKCSRCSTAPGS